MMDSNRASKITFGTALSVGLCSLLIFGVFVTVYISGQRQQSKSSASLSQTNLIQNPLFNMIGPSWLSPWSFKTVNGASATISQNSQVTINSNDSADILVNKASSTDWYIQLLQNGINLTSGRYYTISFWAKASNPRPLRIAIQKNSGNYDFYFQKSYTVSNSWSLYTGSFIESVTDSNALLDFNVAQQTGNVWIDDVSLIQGVSTFTPTPMPPHPTVMCIPPPVCIYARPRCEIAVPINGWCPPLTITQGIPTPTPTIRTPTPSTPVPTNTITLTPSPILTPSDTQLSLTVYLHGIGNGGDSSNPNSKGNFEPLHPVRPIDLQIYDSNNNLTASVEGSVTFNSSLGYYKGTIDVGSMPTGDYTVKVKTYSFLRNIIPGIQVLTQGINTLPPVYLIAGDITNQNTINILDYNILMGCFSDLLPPTSCTPNEELTADLNDQGVVNEYTYNLFLRELANQNGQ